MWDSITVQTKTGSCINAHWQYHFPPLGLKICHQKTEVLEVIEIPFKG